MKKEKLIELLKTKSKDELIKELASLSEKFTAVQDYFDLKYKGKPKSTILKKYKQKIDRAVYPDWELDEGLDIDLVEKILKRFSNVTSQINDQIELELYALEAANKCADIYGGDFGEDYFLYFEELFDRILNKCRVTKIPPKMIKKIEGILEMAFEGYGHQEMLKELWGEYKQK